MLLLLLSAVIKLRCTCRVELAVDDAEISAVAKSLNIAKRLVAVLLALVKSLAKGRAAEMADDEVLLVLDNAVVNSR